MTRLRSFAQDRAGGVVAMWVAVFGGAVLVRLVYWATVTPKWVPNADADQYVQLSRSLAHGRGFGFIFPQLAHHPTAFRPPLYPALLTPGVWLFGNALWPARLLSVVLGSLVVVLAGVLAARIGGRLAGLTTSAVVALYPPLLANDTVTLTEPLSLALLLGSILLLDDERWGLAGLATGLLLLTRPNGYLMVVVLAIWCWQRIGLTQAARFGLVALLVLLPWLARNQVQVGTWRPTTSDGFTLAAIYAKPAQEAGTFIDPAYSQAYDDPDHRLARFDEVTWNDVLTRDAIRGLKENPSSVWRTAGQNFRGYFELSPRLNVYPEINDGRSMRFRSAALPIFYAVTLLGLAGLALRRRDPRVMVLGAITTQFVALSLVLVAPPRLRAPFDVACAIGCGLLVAELTSWRARRGRQPSPQQAGGQPV